MLLSIALAMASITSSFDVSGVHVILRQNNANNVVAANLYLLGGARQVTEGNAGIEPILLDVSERGTQRYPKNSLRRAMSRLGSEIVVAPSADWTLFGIRSSTEVFDSTWAIFADRVMRPTLAKSEVSLVKAQYLSGIRQRRDDPDALAGYLADSITFVGHPYAVSVGGNERSLQTVDSATLREYHRSQFVKSRMLLVVVGNIDRAHIERLVNQSIGQLPVGSYKWSAPPRVPESPTAVVIERRQLPTNYILGYYSGPLANGRDYQALRVATSVLTGRMFAEIRTRQNLTYDVHAPFIDRAATAGGLYVSTVAPDTTLKLMRAAIVDLQQGMLDPAGLRQLEEQFITEYFLDNETNAAQADFLARSELYEGSYKEADRFVDELKRVTPEDVQRVARKYMKGFRFAYVGDPSKLNARTISLF
jgi:zinc protease